MVIQSEGEKTIIVSSGISNIPVSGSRVTISSSSWINVEAESNIVHQEEPVKPPRLKKIARQQSKQDMLRDKGFGCAVLKKEEAEKTITPSGRPDISSPILINSTLHPDELETHKCIPVSRSQSSSTKSSSSFTDGSFYTLESVLDETYGARNVISDDEFNEHIYEEIQENRLLIRPLPPIPEGEQRMGSGSIFTGATRSEILHYLNDARQRLGGHSGPSDTESFQDENYSVDGIFLGIRNNKHRISAISNISESSNSSNDSSSSDSHVLWRGAIDTVAGRPSIERNDSGVGSDFGTSSGSKITTEVGKSSCDDCETPLTDNEPLCHKCNKRRAERKEIINEIVETEIKYGKDLGIIMNEFYKPILGKWF